MRPLRAVLACTLFLGMVPLCRGAVDTMDLSDRALDQRIEQVRKGNFTVTLRDTAGRPATGTATYTLNRHLFDFGTAVTAGLLLADPARDSNAREYQQRLKTYFNCAVAGNAHKWYAMEKQRGNMSDEEAMGVWRRCRELGLPMRGHCIFWGVGKYVQPWVKSLPPAELQSALQTRMRHVLTLFDGKIAEWDLNNEMMHEDVYGRALGWTNGATYFEWAHTIAPATTFYVNEYGVLQGDEADRYVNHIRALQAAGARVGGIGDQAHFVNGVVPPSLRLWEILDKLGSFHLPVKITEFDINTKDEARQAEDTRRFYRVCFAHPAVRGILMWGFWEGDHWIPNAALWRKDWTIKPNGAAYVKLMEEWRTSGTGAVDDAGRLRFRGFYGDYLIRQGERTWRATLNRDQAAVDAVPEPAGP